MSKTHAVCLVTLAIVLFSRMLSVNADDAIKKKILELYPQADTNSVISDAEEAVMSRQALKRYPTADKDGDGVLSDAEKQALLRRAANRAKRKPVDSTTEKSESKKAVDSIFSTEEILDESTLEPKTLQDWHPVGATRQKLVEINVAEWWPGQDYRIPVRLIVPLEGKAKGFHITGRPSGGVAE